MKTYEIYSIKEEGNEEVIAQTIDCIQPSKLQSYKKLGQMFNVGNLFAYGYRVKES